MKDQIFVSLDTEKNSSKILIFKKTADHLNIEENKFLNIKFSQLIQFNPSVLDVNKDYIEKVQKFFLKQMNNPDILLKYVLGRKSDEVFLDFSITQKGKEEDSSYRVSIIESSVGWTLVINRAYNKEFMKAEGLHFSDIILYFLNEASNYTNIATTIKAIEIRCCSNEQTNSALKLISPKDEIRPYTLDSENSYRIWEPKNKESFKMGSSKKSLLYGESNQIEAIGIFDQSPWGKAIQHFLKVIKISPNKTKIKVLFRDPKNCPNNSSQRMRFFSFKDPHIKIKYLEKNIENKFFTH